MERVCRVCGTAEDVYPKGHKHGKICQRCQRHLTNEYTKDWQARNREKVRAGVVDWCRRNPDKREASARAYQERLAAVGGPPSEEDTWFIFNRDRCCLACGSTRYLAVDHILAVINGGDSSRENLQLLCKFCNSSKGTKTIDYRKDRRLA